MTTHDPLDLLAHVAAGRLQHAPGCGWWEGQACGSVSVVPPDADSRCTCGVSRIVAVARSPHKNTRIRVVAMVELEEAHSAYRALPEEERGPKDPYAPRSERARYLNLLIDDATKRWNGDKYSRDRRLDARPFRELAQLVPDDMAREPFLVVLLAAYVRAAEDKQPWGPRDVAELAAAIRRGSDWGEHFEGDPPRTRRSLSHVYADLRDNGETGDGVPLETWMRWVDRYLTGDADPWKPV